MAAPRLSSFLALRGDTGAWLMEGPRDAQRVEAFPGSQTNRTRVMAFSSDGELIAFNDGRIVRVVSLPDLGVVHEIDRLRVASAAFSPNGKVLALWETYITSKDIPAGTHNMGLYCMKTGALLKGFIQKKLQGWCPQWSEDEGVCARNVNNELHFFENNNFDTIHTKLHLQKVSDFQLAPKGGSPYHVAAYVPGSKGQPSFVRIYKYPNFAGPNVALSNKSFFKADRVEMVWNNKGTALLLLTATDTSGESYYGEQGLHFMDINGDTCIVPRSKNGPVYSVAWNPKATNFCVVYGFMPAKATLYNLKAEAVFDYGTGPRNECHFNPHGNILCLAGFGNLRGNVEFWNVQSKVQMSSLRVPDSTQFEWCPDGEHCVTATTSPRLRVGNCYKIWHYMGNVIYEEDMPEGKELWQVQWQPALEGTFAPPRINTRPAQPVAPSEMPGHDSAIASLANVKESTYVPPHLRNNPSATRSGPKFRDDYEPASNVKNPQGDESMSKQALKNKKKREAKKLKAQDMAPEATPTPPAEGASVPASTGDPEKDKQIKSIRKKIQAVEKLKAKQAAGGKLELNQLEKLKSEASLLAELESLTL